MSDLKKPSPNTVIQDSYDQVMFKNIRSASKAVKDLTGARDQDQNLAADVFASFYKRSPQIDENAANPQRALMEELHKLPEFAATRGYTQFDDVASTLATLKFGQTMLEQFRKVDQEQKQNQDGQPGDPGDEPGLDESTLQRFRNAARQALEESQDEAEKWRGAVDSFGITPGDLAKLPTAKKLELAETLLRNPAIHRIAKLVGRFKNLALGARAVTPSHGFDEVVDIGQGSEISRLLPAEMLKFSKAKTLFFKDYTERSLAIYNMRGTDYMGLGPLVVCGDVSGSMSGPREEWCKAVILALIQVAEKQKRPVAIYTFEEPVVGRWLFPKGQKVSIEDKLNILAYNSNGGGTNFNRVLNEAMNFVQKEGGAEFRPADIVFVTDGDYTFKSHDLKAILEKKKQSGIRTFGMNVAGENARIDQSLSLFCDAVFTVTDTGDVSQARGAFVGVMKREERGSKKRGA